MYQLRQAAPIQPGGLRALREQGSGGAQIQRGELPRAVQALQQVQRRQYVGLQAFADGGMYGEQRVTLLEASKNVKVKHGAAELELIARYYNDKTKKIKDYGRRI
jgi:hypothetical protein